ncbi:MAG: hypothetical protein U1E05_22430 [Patescibacteria group bacterium]|nr:hypothetical protein [Patescibacteria group bacterium]
MGKADPIFVDSALRRRPGALQKLMRFSRTKPLGAAGGVIVAVLVVVAVFAPLVAPHEPNELSQRSILKPPNSEFIMGTDDFGRDIFSRIVYGSRVSLYVGIFSMIAGTTSGALLGLLGGYFGGRTDNIIQRIMDIMLAFPMLVLALAIGSRRPGMWLALVAAGAAGWVLTGLAVAGMHRAAFPKPEALRPQPCVVVDRTVSDAPLCKGGFIAGYGTDQGDGDGYGMMEQWIPRLGYYIRREAGPAAFSGDALLVITPTRAVSREFQRQLVQYVENGGNLLVIETPENTGSTANSLLWPFGLSVHPGQAWRGPLSMAGDWPGSPVARALEVSGGEPIARLGIMTVGATTQYGKGRVVAIGFGSLLNDAGMGYEWTAEPDEALLTRFRVLFSLVELTVEGTPITKP